jgi:hypothetical protein
MSIVTALATEAVVIISIAGFDYQNVSRELTTVSSTDHAKRFLLKACIFNLWKK